MSATEKQVANSSNAGIIERFEEERTQWTEDIRVIARRFKNIDDMVLVHREGFIEIMDILIAIIQDIPEKKEMLALLKEMKQEYQEC